METRAEDVDTEEIEVICWERRPGGQRSRKKVQGWERNGNLAGSHQENPWRGRKGCGGSPEILRKQLGSWLQRHHHEEGH